MFTCETTPTLKRIPDPVGHGIGQPEGGVTIEAVDILNMPNEQSAREIGDRRGEGAALFNMSLALDALGNRAQAIVKAEAALEIYEQIESPYADRVRKQVEEWSSIG